MKKFWKYILYIVIAGVVVFILIQFVPYGRDHPNPPTTVEPKWDSPQTRLLAKEHCFQCHSNETEWPWYTNIAPASWLIYHDVVQARRNFNFSQWDTDPGYVGDLVAAVQENRMPPIQYRLFHPNSLLSGQQKQDFIQGLQNTLKK
jgi:mono/diheme cytochrome c family protein